jgi:hypothetical protein
MPCPPHSSWFDHPNNIWWWVQTTPYRLSATAYSMYSQLPSTSGGCSSTRNLRTRHAMVTGTHLSWCRYASTAQMCSTASIKVCHWTRCCFGYSHLFSIILSP